MKALARIIALFLFSLAFSKSIAQSYLEFVENKGQWDKQIQFKGDLTNGAFALKADGGYRMLLMKPSNLHNHAIEAETMPITAGTNMKKVQSIRANSNAPTATTNSESNLRGHVYEMKFLNANPSPIVVPDKPLNFYNNYFIGNDPKKWAAHCSLFHAVTYQDIYPNIDVRYYSDQGKLKYDFIVHPGGDPNQIALYFSGADGLKISSENLVIKNSVQDVVEQKPISYQLTSIGKKDISCNFVVNGNIVRLRLNDPINPRETLVIDPLIFSTFTGSQADNWGYTATYDNRGNFYAGGIVFAKGFPVSNGAFQQNFNGQPSTRSFNIGIIKFNNVGTDRIYATYIGGSDGNEQPHSLIVDKNYNLIIGGRTTSSDYPGTRFGPANSQIGKWDIVLTKLNLDGSALIGSKIIGGSDDDGVNIKDKESYNGGYAESINQNYGDDSRSEVMVDNDDNIYLASCTQSTNFPVTDGTTNGGKNSAGRSQDAVLIKFDPLLSTALFSTYLGGKDDDAAFVLAINPSNNDIYVAGATASQDFPGNKTNALYQFYQGGKADGFIAIYSNAGVLKKSTFFGSSGTDIIFGIQFDKFSFPYIMGTTTGLIPVQKIPSQNAIYSETGGKQFITKLNQDLGSVVYSTNFGTKSSIPNISPTAFLVDRCENVYVSGWGGLGNTLNFDITKPPRYPSAGTKNLSVTRDAIMSTTDGSDFYFIVLSKNSDSLKYGSFFGQKGGEYPDHVDGGTSRFDKNGIIYQAICGNCFGGAYFFTSAGAYATHNGTGTNGCNLAALKIAFNLAGIGTDLITTINGRVRDTSGCVPLTVDFVDSSAMGKMYVWDFGDNSKRDTTPVPKISHKYLNVGVYRAKLISIDSSSCNISDSASINIRVRADEAILGFDAVKLPPCTSLKYEFTNTSTPPNSSPAKPFNDTSFLWKFGDGSTLKSGSATFTHTYLATGTYNVEMILMDSNYCNQLYSVKKTIRIADRVVAKISTDSVGCKPYLAQLNNTSLGGTDFIWDFGDNSPLDIAISPSHLYSNVGSYRIKLIANDTTTCNKIDSTFFTINVYPNPTSIFDYTPQPTLPNTAVNFINSSQGGSLYNWDFGDGYVLKTTKIDTTIKHVYPATGTFNTCLITTNIYGCSVPYCNPISVIINPQVDLPNAFTPNGDGINDRIYVRGYGIAEMTWRIYDRWGNMVYASADQNRGWDGTFNGKPLAQDVYHYTLQVMFYNNEKFVKKGDITLLK